VSIRVFCVSKTDRMNPHERIKGIGGFNANNTRWWLTVPAAIAGIREGKWSFYVENPPGHRVEVIIAYSTQGHEYLKTVADGEHPNNLLYLPECPPL
jgi:hypothetical protein